MSVADPQPLAGRRVLVTRPAERSAGLIERIRAAGGEPIAFPVIEIVPLALPPLPDTREFAAVLFVSPAAARYGAALLQSPGARPPPVGAVGPATAAALEATGLRVDIRTDATPNSEGLLACAALGAERVRGRRVLIVRGKGGRERLASGLVERGATVEYAEVYRRARPSRYDPELASGYDIATATSVEAVDNLLAMVPAGERDRMLQRPLAVAAQRIADHARRCGFTGRVVTAADAGDEALMAAIVQCEQPPAPTS